MTKIVAYPPPPPPHTFHPSSDEVRGRQALHLRGRGRLLCQLHVSLPRETKQGGGVRAVKAAMPRADAHPT